MKSGWTLIEWLASLALWIILFSFAFPFTVGWYQNTQLQAVSDKVKQAIQIARIQALSLGKPLLLTHLTTSTDWSEGMVLCVADSNASGHCTSEVLQAWHWAIKDIALEWHGFQSDDYLFFTPVWQHNACNGYFTVKANAGNPIRLVVNRFGRVRSS